MITEHDIRNIDKILYDGYGDWFTAHLLRLISHADHDNLTLLGQVYPAEVRAVTVHLMRSGEY